MQTINWIRQKADIWANEKKSGMLSGKYHLNSSYVCTYLRRKVKRSSLDGWYSRKRWLIFLKEKLHLSLMIAKQFLFPMLQMISACIPLYLALSIFVPAAPSENFLPWVIIPLKYLQTALRCPLSTDLQSESKECVGCAQAQLQRQCHSLYHQHCTAMGRTFKSITLLFCQSTPSTYRNSPEDLNAFAKFTLEPR